FRLNQFCSPGQRPGLGRLERGVTDRLKGDQPIEGTQQLTHIVYDQRSYRLEHALTEAGATVFRRAPENGDPGLIIRSRDIDPQPAGKAANEPFVQRLDLGRRTVAG